MCLYQNRNFLATFITTAISYYVKLSQYQAVGAHGVLRRRGSHIFWKIFSQIACDTVKIHEKLPVIMRKILPLLYVRIVHLRTNLHVVI